MSQGFHNFMVASFVFIFTVIGAFLCAGGLIYITGWSLRDTILVSLSLNWCLYLLYTNSIKYQSTWGENPADFILYFSLLLITVICIGANAIFIGGAFMNLTGNFLSQTGSYIVSTIGASFFTFVAIANSALLNRTDRYLKLDGDLNGQSSEPSKVLSIHKEAASSSQMIGKVR